MDLERLDELQETFYSDAVKGDVQAAAILLNIAERRSAYLGIDVILLLVMVEFAKQ